MKVMVVGAGAQGGPCVSILTRDRDVSKILLADIDMDLVRKVVEKVGSKKVEGVQVDASDVASLKRAAEGMDVIINLTVTIFNPMIMQAALEVGAHYVDTSFGEPKLLDIRAKDNILKEIIEGAPIQFDAEYKSAGLTALVGCGSSPGVVNVLARYACDKLDRVEAIKIKLGRSIHKPKDEIVSGWSPTWSPFRALWGYAVEPTVFVNGQYKRFPIFSNYEVYEFPEPVGEVPLVYHQHQEPITLPYFIGKGIQYCDFKYTVDYQAGTLIKTGFARMDPIRVKGVEVSPFDVLMALVKRPVNTFLEEDEESAGAPLKVVAGTTIEVSGWEGEDKVEYDLFFPTFLYLTPKERLEIYRKFGASNIYVAAPAVVGAKMCVQGKADRGVIAAECLEPLEFLKEMTEIGAPVRFREVHVRQVEIA